MLSYSVKIMTTNVPSEKVRPKHFVMGVPHRVVYTNWRGETAERTIVPINIWYGVSEYHEGEQWFVKAVCRERGEVRDFAMKDLQPNWD